MNSRDAIQLNLDMATMVCTMYLADLDDRDLLVRPSPGCNHIAWQLGHLIANEHAMMELLKPGSMPPLPAGFAEKHTTATSRLDSPLPANFPGWAAHSLGLKIRATSFAWGIWGQATSRNPLENQY